jgi:hypothetical protein
LGGLLGLGTIEFIQLLNGAFGYNKPAAIKKIVSPEPVVGQETKPGDVSSRLMNFLNPRQYLRPVVYSRFKIYRFPAQHHYGTLIITQISKDLHKIFRFTGFD